MPCLAEGTQHAWLQLTMILGMKVPPGTQREQASAMSTRKAPHMASSACQLK